MSRVEGESGDSIAAAKRYLLRRQEVMANNLANATTDGFKAERVFARVLAEADAGGPVAHAATDLRAGTLQPTGRPLDLALDGPGFFVVATPGGERLTRSGAFQAAGDGTIVDVHGNALLGADGPLVLTGDADAPVRAVAVDAGGVVHADGRVMGHLRIEAVPDGATLQHEGGTHFVPPASRRPLAEVTGVRQGMLEASNVNALDALVEMITIQRRYGALEQADSVGEAIDDRVNQLGKPVP